MSVKDIKEAEKIALDEIRKMKPKLIEDVEKGIAKKEIREYKTKRDKEFYELKITETIKLKSKDKEIEKPQITIITINKKTGEKKISVSG